MARTIRIDITCDLDGTPVKEEDIEVVTFEWRSERYSIDVGPECLPMVEHNTIGALIEVARPADDDALSGGGGGVHRQAKTTTAKTGGKKIGPPKGARRYSWADYYDLWGTLVNGVAQLTCPHGDYNSSLANGVQFQNQKAQQVRQHMARAHNELMWQEAAKLRGDSYGTSP